jgi:DNA-binding HxlR family transcriptional regulator
MRAQQKKVPSEPPVARMVENIIRCKWSLSVLELVKKGINRPGAMERAVEGLTTKVLNERLRKLVRFGILSKRSYPEVPPRVEYELTDFGRRFLKILDAIEELQVDVNRG